MILVSSCLCGEKCKYSGGDNYNQVVIDYCENKEIIQVCPEVMGGLSTPRIPAEIVGGTAKEVIDGKAKILTKEGKDVTKAFMKGAKEVLRLAQIHNVQEVILKANSPSCGKGQVYDGTFNGQLIKGNGLTAQLLIDAGIEIKTEKDFK